MTALECAKQSLPLPALLAQLGYDDRAKKSSRCPLHEDRNNSFSVFQNAAGEWKWNCFASCGSGDEADFIGQLEKLDSPAACRRYIELAGTKGDGKPSLKQSVAKSAPTYERPEVPLPMPVEVSDAWREGLDFAQAHRLLAKHLAQWRGWSEAFSQHVIDCATVSMPVYEGERGIAFQVVTPVGERGSMSTLPIGYHIRVKPDSREEKASWRYFPNRKNNGHGIPALPYILGDFEQAELLVIAEGQWEILTFGLAAGWLGEGCIWPDAVTAIGIRGVSGVYPFLQHYRRFWPSNANCLLLPDGDGAGSRWFEGKECFADRLAGLCQKVAVVKCGEKKDFNDLYKAGPITPDQITALLESHGMTLETAVTV